MGELALPIRRSSARPTKGTTTTVGGHLRRSVASHSTKALLLRRAVVRGDYVDTVSRTQASRVVSPCQSTAWPGCPASGGSVRFAMLLGCLPVCPVLWWYSRHRTRMDRYPWHAGCREAREKKKKNKHWTVAPPPPSLVSMSIRRRARRAGGKEKDGRWGGPTTHASGGQCDVRLWRAVDGRSRAQLEQSELHAPLEVCACIICTRCGRHLQCLCHCRLPSASALHSGNRQQQQRERRRRDGRCRLALKGFPNPSPAGTMRRGSRLWSDNRWVGWPDQSRRQPGPPQNTAEYENGGQPLTRLTRSAALLSTHPPRNVSDMEIRVRVMTAHAF